MSGRRVTWQIGGRAVMTKEKTVEKTLGGLAGLQNMAKSKAGEFEVKQCSYLFHDSYVCFTGLNYTIHQGVIILHIASHLFFPFVS